MNAIEALVRNHPGPWEVVTWGNGSAVCKLNDRHGRCVLLFVGSDFADVIARLPDVEAALRETDTLLNGGYVTADGWDSCERRSAYERIDRVRELVRAALAPKETT